MSSKYLKPNYPFYIIVADGGLSVPALGEGRVIPALIIDVEDDMQVSEYIKLHSQTPPGDTKSQWALPNTFFSPKQVYLSLECERPMKFTFGIEFDLVKQYAVLDGIIQSRAFCLMTGKTGDKVSQKIKESILIEVPNGGFDKKWNALLYSTLTKKFKGMGASKKEALKLANEQIKGMREVWDFRRQS